MQLRMCVLKNSNFQGRSPYVVKWFSMLLETTLKGKNSLLLGANSYLQEKFPLWKGTQPNWMTASCSSLPLIYVTFSAFWLRLCSCSNAWSPAQTGSRLVWQINHITQELVTSNFISCLMVFCCLKKLRGLWEELSNRQIRTAWACGRSLATVR